VTGVRENASQVQMTEPDNRFRQIADRSVGGQTRPMQPGVNLNEDRNRHSVCTSCVFEPVRCWNTVHTNCDAAALLGRRRARPFPRSSNLIGNEDVVNA
jgi:hypothetical protein